MSRSLAGQGPMFVMVMDTVELGRGLGRTGGQAAGREGTGGLGDKLAGDVCCTLSQASQLWVTPGLAVPVRKSPEEIPGFLSLGGGTNGSTPF